MALFFVFKYALPTLEPQKTALVFGEKKSQKRVKSTMITHEFYDIERFFDSTHAFDQGLAMTLLVAIAVVH